VTGNQHLGVSCTLNTVFAVRQVACFKARVYINFVFPLLQAFQLLLTQAKSPRLVVVASAVGNPIRRFRQRKEMRSQLGKRHLSPHWNAVVQYVQIGPLKIRDAFARLVLYVCVADIPFLRNGPVEYLGAGRDLMQFQWDGTLEQAQTLSHAVARNAPANRIKGLNKPVGCLALFRRVKGLQHIAQRTACEISFIVRLARHDHARAK